MIKKIIFFSCAVALFSCNSNTPNNVSVSDTTKIDTTKKMQKSEPINDNADFKFTTLVINIPSPFEILTIIPKSGISYNKSLINSTENESKYITTTKKGLNYGSYVVDLVYLSLNEQFSDVKKYFITSRNLAKSLGCAESFDKIAGSRLEKNIDKKDTINRVMNQIYTEMDKYLRSNDQILSATQILVGSWIESQYITVSLLKVQTKNKDNEALFQQVSYQNFTSQKLVELFKEYENEKDFKPVMKGVKELDKIYSGIKQGEISKATLDKLYTKLSEVRGLIVK